MIGIHRRYHLTRRNFSIKIEIKEEKKKTTLEEREEVMLTLSCQICEKEFIRYQSRIKKSGNVYCSHECARIARMHFISDSDFRFDANLYHYKKPDKKLGSYENLTLSKRKQAHISRNLSMHYLFQNGIKDEFTAYFYGLLLTDGSVHETSEKKKRISLFINDQDIVMKVASSLGCPDKVRNYGKRYRLQIHSDTLFNDLRALGCTKNKTQEANYPLIPKDLDQHFIRGVLDGDGSFSIRNRHKEFYLKFFGNHLLLYGLYIKIKEHVRVSPSNIDYPIDYDRRYTMNSYCFITYNKYSSLKIRDWVYENAKIYGNRKHQLAYEY